jgi:hypothetical protein
LLRTVLGWSIGSSNDESSGPDKVTLSRRGTFRLEPKSGIPARLEVPYSEEDLSGKNMALGLGILAAVLVAVYSASQKLIPAPMVRPPLLQEEDVLAVQAAKYEGIILIGAPRMAKDRTIETAVHKITHRSVHRIPLLDAELSKAFIETKLEEVRKLPTTGKDGYVDSQGCIWVLVSNLESQLVTAESRTLVLQLLEKLFEAATDDPRRVVIVSSAFDPIAHFEEIFEHEREGIYKDPIPEVELSRSSLVLSRFRRRYLPVFCPETREPPVWENWLRYNPSKWPHTAQVELRAYTPLLGLEKEIRSAWHESKVPLEMLAHTVKNKAHVYYELLWTSCTRSEKLVLIQLAQEGFVNPKSRETMTQLIAKGLITEHGAIFNYTFRGFLRGIERSHVIHAWESMEGSGLWVVAGRLIASSMVAGGVFYLLTQDFSVQSLLPIISGTGVFEVPIVRNLLARVSGKPASVDTA